MQKKDAKTCGQEYQGSVIVVCPYIYKNMPINQEVHRDCNAPCGYTYTGSSGK
jgi:hypothetical protein